MRGLFQRLVIRERLRKIIADRTPPPTMALKVFAGTEFLLLLSQHLLKKLLATSLRTFAQSFDKRPTEGPREVRQPYSAYQPKDNYSSQNGYGSYQANGYSRKEDSFPGF